MPWRRVESSLLVSVGYDAEARHLDLELAGGAVYRYFDVPELVHRQLLAAASLGAFYNRAIRDRYRCTLLRYAAPA
jgi:hypothetical protein